MVDNGDSLTLSSPLRSEDVGSGVRASSAAKTVLLALDSNGDVEAVESQYPLEEYPIESNPSNESAGWLPSWGVDWAARATAVSVDWATQAATVVSAYVGPVASSVMDTATEIIEASSSTPTVEAGAATDPVDSDWVDVTGDDVVSEDTAASDGCGDASVAEPPPSIANLGLNYVWSTVDMARETGSYAAENLNSLLVASVGEAALAESIQSVTTWWRGYGVDHFGDAKEGLKYHVAIPTDTMDAPLSPIAVSAVAGPGASMGDEAMTPPSGGEEGTSAAVSTL